MMIDTWVAANDNFPPVSGKDGKLYKLAEACDDATALSKLTDDWINQTIRNSSDPGLEKARQILKRIDDRDKYKVIAQITHGSLEKNELHYEESLLSSSKILGFSSESENDENLKSVDLCIIKNYINMGRKDKTNPVLGMLFYDKEGNVEGKSEEDLKEIAPEKIYEEKLFVLCRRNGQELWNSAAQAVHSWVEQHLDCDWKVKYLVKANAKNIPQIKNNSSMSPIFGIQASGGVKSEE